MTEDQLAAFVPDLIRWEGATTWMYRDTLGYVTVGIGNLVHDADDAGRLAFMVGERSASGAEVQRDFLRVVALAKGMPAARYRSPEPPHVELTQNGVRDLAIGRLRYEFLPGLARLLPGFDTFPSPAQRALVDMAWNLGIHGLAQFSHLVFDVGQRNWSGAATACHRKTSREERNAWCADLFRSAA